MEDIEKVRMLVSLKGERLWLRGEILDTPFHPEILQEIQRNPDLVEILKRKVSPKPEKVEEKEESKAKVGVTKRQLLSRRKKDD